VNIYGTLKFTKGKNKFLILSNLAVIPQRSCWVVSFFGGEIYKMIPMLLQNADLVDLNNFLKV
jgi:hypothetical protein